ncbi:hypothetical protein PR048_022992 [Dryococelus australis]|uniref:MADF domain-containing protein n=1 Tax=Dryococelus australis TaxID=614101 RepID=A0ABQ9GSU0_9NEOP|nr:hypothetical protein PR048_022992 [Dryococelus australis]
MSWDCRSNEYKNRDQNKAALKEIAEVFFNCTNEEVLRKVHNLRDQVSQELQKIRKEKVAALVEKKRVNVNTSMQ